MPPQIDDNFREAVERVKTALKRMRFTPETFTDPFKPGAEPTAIDTPGFSEIGLELSESPTARLSAARLDGRRPPPLYVNTESLQTAIQELLLENTSKNVGINRGDMDAFAMQTQFLLDLQRYVARKSMSRMTRIIRAGHRRVQLTKPGGPLAQLTRRIEERFAASGDRT